jgi:transposase-like protein
MIVDPVLSGLAAKITQSYSNAQIARLIRMISPVSPCALMAADEFERVMNVLAGRNRRRAFSDRSISAARLVLVMGASVSEAASETGLTRQVVHRLMARIRARMEDLPADWVKVETWLPSAAAGEVLALAESLRSARSQ